MTRLREFYSSHWILHLMCKCCGLTLRSINRIWRSLQQHKCQIVTYKATPPNLLNSTTQCLHQPPSPPFKTEIQRHSPSKCTERERVLTDTKRTAMAHLPCEIWLLIASHCDPKDLWLSMRKVSQQLKECAEQHFEREILPQAVLSLPIAIPTYDMRHPIRGRAVFLPSMKPSASEEGANSGRVFYSLVKTEPDFYESRFLSRWASMKSANAGHLNPGTSWQIDLCGRTGRVGLKQGFVDDDEESVWDGTRVSFAWRPTMTLFFILDGSFML